HFTADRSAPQLATGDLVQCDDFRLAGAIQHHAEASPYRAGNEVIGALTPLDVTAGTIDCCYCAIGTGGKDEFTIDGGGQLVVVLALTVTNLDAPASLQAYFLLEIHQFCWLFNVIIAEHAATTQGQQGYGQ